MTSSHSARTTLRPATPTLDDELARAVIVARVRRHHRRHARVLTRF